MTQLKSPKVDIRVATPSDLEDVARVTKEAFQGEEEVHLVKDLLQDPSAEPVLSLIAIRNEQTIGHILFTAAHFSSEPHSTPMSILAPLSVVPDAQSQGVGGALIRAGLEHLSDAGQHLVFVLGHPDYYPRSGFQPAGRLGFEAPFPIPNIHAEAWMVQALVPGALETNAGRIKCADMLNKVGYWQE